MRLKAKVSICFIFIFLLSSSSSSSSLLLLFLLLLSFYYDYYLVIEFSWPWWWIYECGNWRRHDSVSCSCSSKAKTTCLRRRDFLWRFTSKLDSPFRKRTGVKVETADFGPVDDFRLFFADNLFTLFNICEQTNLFAEQFFDNPVNCSEHIELVLIIYFLFFFFRQWCQWSVTLEKGLFVVVMTSKADMWQIIRLIRSSIACDDALSRTLSKVDKKPWGRRPEVKIPLTVLLRMLHSSST